MSPTIEWKELEPMVEQVRKNLKEASLAMGKIDTTLLPEQDDELKRACQLLDNDMYDVVVCGEVKKGKSSFINAIIGDDILPTNTEVATSQVFRIINGSEQRFTLVFTDGTRKQISRDELSRYGSQVDADASGEPVFRNHVLDYIEVCTPIAFLPGNVAIVDTPGIGALYTAHERITARYLHRAAAVVFILDPQNPITEPERKFVEKALSVTSQMLFVMTKMDNYDADYIMSMAHRNEELLAPLAPNTQSKSIEVLPMSSKTLYTAAKEDIDVLRDVSVEESRFEPVRNALLTMIQRTVGLSRNAFIFNELNRYNTAVMASVAEQTKVLSETVASKELLEQKEQLRQKFIADWGPNGTNQKEIIQRIDDHIGAVHSQMTTLVSQVGPIYTKYSEEIDKLEVEEIENYAKAMPSRLQDDFGNYWMQIVEECQEGIQLVLRKYHEDLNGDVDKDISKKLDTVLHPITVPKMDYMQIFNHGRNGFISASMINMVLGFFNPVLGVVGMLLSGGFLASNSYNKQKLASAQNEFYKFLSNSISTLYNETCVKPISSEEPYSVLQKTERSMRTAAQDGLNNIYSQQKANVDKDLNTITEQIKKEGSERANALKVLAGIRMQWAPVNQKIVATNTLLVNLEKQLNRE